MLIRLFIGKYAQQIKKVATFIVTTIIPLFYTTNLSVCLPGVMLTIVDVICTYLGDPAPNRILTVSQRRNLRNKVSRGYILCTSMDGKVKMKHLDTTYDQTKYILDGNIICNCYYKQETDQDIVELYGDEMDIKYFIDKIDYLEKDQNEFTVRILKGNRLHNFNYRSNPVYAREFVGYDVFNFIDSKVKKFMDNYEFYERTGLPYKIGFCFAGVKGLGKTQIAYAMAKFYKLNIIEVPPDYTFDLTEHSVSFDKSVVLLDDFDLFDAVVPRKDTEIEEDMKDFNESSDKKKMVQKSKLKLKDLMKFLEGHYFYQTIIIATTNYPDMIEDALLRPGRLDYLVKFDLIGDREIKDVLERFYNNKDEKIDLEKYTFNPITISSLIHDYVIPNMHDLNSCIKQLTFDPN